MAAPKKNTPVSNSEEDDALFDYLNSLSPLKSKKYDGVGATTTLNSLGMDYSLLNSPDPIYLKDYTRNNLLDKSMHKVSSGNVNKIYSHEEALKNSSHASRHSSERHHPLGLLGKKDSVEGGTVIREVGQKNTNKSRNNLANVALMDINPIQRKGDDEVSYRRCTSNINSCSERSCQGYESETTNLQRNNSVYTSNINSCSAKSNERNASNEKTLLPNENTSDSKIRVLQGNGIYLNALPALKHGKEEESVDFCRANPKRKKEM